jgi:hypothetical protein
MSSTRNEYQHNLYGWLSYAITQVALFNIHLAGAEKEKEVPCSGLKSDIQNATATQEVLLTLSAVLSS